MGISRFKVVRTLGEGGMGDVVLAIHPITQLPVAIKKLKAELVSNSLHVQRFLTEARHMYHINHPNILRIMEVSDDPAGPFYVMSYMEGGSLAQRIKRGVPADRGLVLKVAVDVAKALAYAHSKGIIHRDLKPHNVLFDAEGRAYLSDFGLLRSFSSNDPGLSVSRSVIEGTAHYMSPAVARGEAEDTRCDIYSFGAMLYELLTGSLPYTGASFGDVLKNILAAPPKPILTLNSGAPKDLVLIAEGAMARSLRDRYSSMADVQEDLERVTRNQAPLGPHGRERSRLPVKLVLAATFVTVAILSIVGWKAMTKSRLPAETTAVDLNKPTYEQTPSTRPALRADFFNSIGMGFNPIDPPHRPDKGVFLMGSPDSEPNRVPRMEQQHRVTLTHPYYIGITLVTRGQFAVFVAQSPYKTQGESGGKVPWRQPMGFKQTDDHPVVNVTWNDAVAFCRWLSEKEHKHYRLPTEAEWEYACRAGTKTAFFWGDDPDGGVGFANGRDQTRKEHTAKAVDEDSFFNWRDGFVNTSPVAFFKPNPFGLYDMIGNARQWCSDYFEKYFKDDKVDPTGPASGGSKGNRVERGGSWDMGPRRCRSASRGQRDPDAWDTNVGFRVCLDVTPPG